MSLVIDELSEDPELVATVAVAATGSGT